MTAAREVGSLLGFSCLCNRLFVAITTSKKAQRDLLCFSEMAWSAEASHIVLFNRRNPAGTYLCKQSTDWKRRAG